MNRQLQWDDLRVILAVVEAGTLSGAGRELRLSHATVFRRLGDIEGRLGVKLFERARTGYCATLAGEEVAAAARRVATEVLEVERRVAGRDLRPSGSLRVTTTDTLLFGLLSPLLNEFRKAYRDISLEIAVSNEVFSLSKREADVAIRPCLAPPETLVGRKVGTVAQAIYGRRDVAWNCGGKFDIEAADWVGPDESMAYRMLDRWMEANGVAERCRYRVDTVLGMYAAARDGTGIGILPCYLGDSDERLLRIGETVPALSTDLWLLTHPDLRKTARVRALLDFVSDAIKDCRGRLEGAPQSSKS